MLDHDDAHFTHSVKGKGGREGGRTERFFPALRSALFPL